MTLCWRIERCRHGPQPLHTQLLQYDVLLKVLAFHQHAACCPFLHLTCRSIERAAVSLVNAARHLLFLQAADSLDDLV